MRTISLGNQITQHIPLKEMAKRIQDANVMKRQNFSPEEILEKAFDISEEKFEAEMVFSPFFL